MDNHSQVSQGFRTLLGALAPYIARELGAEFGQDWWDVSVIGKLYDEQKRDLPLSGDWGKLVDSLNIQRCLLLFDLHWNAVFRKRLSIDNRTWAKELVGVRNKLAHLGGEDFTNDDTWRALDTMSRLCEQIDPEGAEEIRTLLRTSRYGTAAGSTTVTEASSTSAMTYKPEPGMTTKQADKAAAKAAADYEKQILQGYVVDNKQVFSEYAEYVSNLKFRNGMKQSTYERNILLLRRINAAIGNMKLKDIRPMHLNMLYKNLSEEGIRENGGRAFPIIDFNALLEERNLRKYKLAELAGVSDVTVSAICKGNSVSISTAEAIAKALNIQITKLFKCERDTSPLSAKTILEHHRLISAILNQAEKEMLVPYNAASKATPPKVQREDVNYFQPEQVRSMLEALSTEPLKWQLITQLLMVTGCRRGEIMGLKWDKIDFDKRRVLIDTALLSTPLKGVYEDTTKTGNRRYIPLPDETLKLLQRHRKTQLEYQLLNGDLWQGTGYVFTQDNGEPMHPDSITSWLGDFSKRHKLPHINPHAFRHTAASVLISQGTDIVTVSKMLGHAKVSTTGDIYSHVIEESKQQASNTLASAFFKKDAKAV